MEQENSLIFEGLNPAQYQAVKNIEGPQLIIAGAGSGKTKVLTCRIANILDSGYSADSILALTFTNKASKEMKERIAQLIGFSKSKRLVMGTFHSVFARFLREESQLLGYPSTFTIYDTTDQRSVIKACIKELKLDDKVYKPNEIAGRISMAKNNLVTAKAYANNNTLLQNDAAAKKPHIHHIYTLYSKKCKEAGAMDFDDILLNTNILFRDFPQALERISSRFNFIMVDEYQDTNYSQYIIVKKLAQKHRNISVVGDDAQSIYSFRGARIENILNFRKDYPDAKEYRLEQNYRSTQTIVNAANSLIAKNKRQLKKKCFSDKDLGEPIELINGYTEQEEAFNVTNSILSQIRQHSAQYSDFAILYRTNAQSRVLEEALRRRNIPYKIYAGHSFYDRAEVKDFLAYLRLISNPKDNEAFKRIINFPARGIGDTTIGKLKELADKLNLSFTDTIKQGDLVQAGIKEATAQKIKQFIATIELFREKMHVTDAYTLALEVDSKFGILNTMKLDTSIEGQGRVENVEELFNSIKEFVEDGEAEYAKMADNEYDVITITLDLYLENVSLLSDLDTNNKEEDFNKVTLMTVHSSKGLEFPYVYIVGCEENLFPSGGIGVAVTEDDIEEERRLFYVAVTRAQKTVKLSYANSRIKWGSHVSNKPSRFLKEIDKEYIKNPLVDFEEEIRTKFDSDSSSQLWGRTPQRRLTSLSSSRTSTPAPGYTQSVSRVQSSVQRASNPNFVADSPHKVQAGQTVEHEKFGIGYVVSVEGDVTNRKAIVEFKVGGRKTLLLKFAKVRIIN